MSDTLKFVVIGDGGIGKTTFSYVYCTGSFQTDYLPTVQDDFTTNETYQNHTVNLHIWDTAGQEEYASIRQLSYVDTHVFLICFSTANKDSLISLSQKWFPELRNNCDKGDPIMVMVGTMLDLKEENPTSEKNCSDELIEQIRQEIGAKAVVLCSAKLNKNVREVFIKALEVYYESENAKKAASGCCNIL